MSLASAAIHRPIFTTVVTLAVVLLGAVSLVRLPVDLMPDLNYPALTVRTTYEDAGPEVVEELISRPIEQAVSSAPGVKEVTSTSSEGNSSVRVTFVWGTDLDTGANDVRDRLDRVARNMPDEADRPTLYKFDTASFPVMMLGASSQLDPVALTRLIENQVRYRIERVPGVAALNLWGGREREIQVNLDRDRVRALGLNLAEIVSRIKAGNVNLPAGRIDRDRMEVQIRTPGEYTDLNELRDTVIAVRAGQPVLLRDVATVVDTWEEVRQLARIDGVPGVRLAVNKQSGANTVQVARGVREEMEKINRDMPQIRLVAIQDTSTYIQRSISNVGSSALYGGALAILVLLFFLRDLRSTLVVALAIPISIIATFALIYFAGYTLNIMTLGGLALGVGMLVDNSIVVLENIFRLRDEEGMSALDAAREGTHEVVNAVIASTLTTVVVFLPLVYVQGLSGVMFKQLAAVITFSLLCSLIVALTLVPSLAARLLRGSTGNGTAAEGRLSAAIGALLHRLELAYRGLLHGCLRHRIVVVCVSILAIGATLLLVPLVGTELMPASDEGEVRVNLEMAVGTRLALVDEAMKQVEAICKAEIPEMDRMVATVGGGGWQAGSHKGDVRIMLVGAKERQRSSEAIAAALRPKLAAIPGATIRTRAGQGLFLFRMMTSGSEQIEIDLRGHDIEVADALAQRVKDVVAGIRGITDVRLSRDPGGPEETIGIDRRKAEHMKLSVATIANTLQTVLAGSSAGNYRDAGDEYRILVQFAEAETMTLDDILNLTIPNADGEPVMLRNVVNVSPRTGPANIDRKDQERVLTVRANLSDRDMGSAIAEIRQALEAIPMPPDFAIVFSGEYEEQQKAFRELALSIVLALILVYMVMACQYESWRDPFVVMFSVPLAAIGVILTLFLTDTTFNIQSFIGCIMLGGIVVNNAIVLVDHINLLRQRDGMPLREAIEEAGRRRIRPILMTALTTGLALLPLALGIGEGGEAQAPLARAVIGGLASSALITLVLVPVIYSLFERKNGAVNRAQ
ncbi:MAG: efflux RND transporter permease subunit [Lentisphaerae bacterium]|nr:efflux RND transporter permease subunit [Lentisphaerota bacterium]